MGTLTLEKPNETYEDGIFFSETNQSQYNKSSFSVAPLTIPNEAPEISYSKGSQRSLEAITEDVLREKHKVTLSFWNLGRYLTELKSLLEYGTWLVWLSDTVDFSVDSAQKYINLFKNYQDTEALRNLGYTKAIILLKIDANERSDFILRSHIINGEEKTVTSESMSTRELQQVVTEYLKAKELANNAESNDNTDDDGNNENNIDTDEDGNNVSRNDTDDDIKSKDDSNRAQDDGIIMDESKSKKHSNYCDAFYMEYDNVDDALNRLVGFAKKIKDPDERYDCAIELRKLLDKIFEWIQTEVNTAA